MTTEFNLLRNVRSEVARSLDQRAKLLTTSATLGAQATAFDAQAAAAAAAGNERAAEAARKRAEAARQKRVATTSQVIGIDERVREQLGRLAQIDPCDAEADVPLALFPVRLETRYTDDGAALRIRIYPDDVHVDQLDRGLSDDERDAGRAYWSAIWPSDDATVAASARVELTNRVHSDRAAWVAAALTPRNLADAGPATAPDFPNVAPRDRRAAVARLLPDRFVAVAMQGQSRSRATGRPIVPELRVGLLSDDGSTLTTAPNGITAPAGAEWIYDYQQALDAGMAVTLPLAQGGAPVDQLIVFGVRASVDVNRSQAMLEDLLTAHRYTRGVAIVPQGAPTNNTESDRAGWQQSITIPPPGRAVASAAASAADAGTNAAVVASALGVDSRFLAGVDHAGEREQPAAHAMNVALWGPSWGTMLDSVTTGVKGGKLSDETREGVRNFFSDSVRGRGPVPALRIGNQPYGILPVGNTDTRWRAHRSDPLEATLLDFLRRVRASWRVSLANVPRVHGGDAALDDTLLEILGSSPIAQGLRVRTVLPSDFPEIVATATGAADDTQALERIIGQMVLGEVLLNASFAHPAGSLAKESRPLPLPLVDASDPAFIAALSRGVTLKIASVLQALLALANGALETAVRLASPQSLIPSLVQSAAVLPEAVQRSVLEIQQNVNAVSTATLHATANLVAAQVGEAGPAVLAQHAPVPALRTSLGELAVGNLVSGSVHELAPLAIGAWLRAEARRSEFRDALAELLKIGDDAVATERRRILVAETLDLASHRLDAWITGLVERRRASLRAARPTGVIVGAYGWVENLSRSRGGSPDGGFIHAPSIAHAATAGLLRNAYLTHNPDAGGSSAFAIDLSSTRVRVAVDLLEGLRQGQSLGALLGYRIERALHEAGLDRLALSLRALAPLVDGQLTTRDDKVPKPAAEAVAAANVVDGLVLLTKFQSDGEGLLNSLDVAPTGNRFLAPGDWQPLTKKERNDVSDAIRSANDAYDAYADLVLAEGVHQLVQGNTARAAAALDAGGSGEATAIEPTVVQTPAQGVPFTHRLMIVARGAGTPWNVERPRGRAEPRLEQWAATRLGAASDIVVHESADGTTTLLDGAGFCALDLIYDSANRTRLEQSIRAAIPSIPADEPLTARQNPAWPPAVRSLFEMTELAASLRELIVRARVAGPADFARASDAPARVVSGAELDAVKARAVEARDGLAAASASLEAALAAADDNAISAALEVIAAYGVTTPRSSADMARVAVAEAHRRLDAADAVLAGALDAQGAGLVSQAIFGDGFWMIPALTPAAVPDLFTRALAGGPGAVSPPNGAVRRFVRDVASVRDAVARCAETLLVGDALGRRTTLRVAQLAAAGTPGADRWVGGVLDPAQPTPESPVTDLILEAPDDFDGTTEEAALVIDQWIDVVPHRAARGEGEDATIDERIVSGLAVNAPAASARAPQAILLAVSPDGARWTSDALLDTLIDTIELAKLRGVTLERTTGAARVLPALYEQSWSLQGEPSLDLRFVKENLVISAVVPYVKEVQK